MNDEVKSDEKSEVKQFNMRLDEATVDRFRKFCEENKLSHAVAFNHVMQVFEVDRAKIAIPERKTEIELFQQLTKDITSAYLHSLKVNQTAEVRIREEFASDLVRKDKTIDDLRQKAEQLKAAKDASEQTATDAVQAKEQAEKTATEAEKFRVAAEQSAADKQTLVDVLTVKLTEAEQKANGFDDLKAALAAEESARKAAEQRIKDVQRDAADAAKDQTREAEKAREQAVREVMEAAAAEKDELKAQIDALKDELRTSKSETDAARKDAETAGKAAEAAKAAAIADLSEAHRAELAEIRAKLDARTDELMQARQEISELQLKVQAAQAAIESLKTKK